MAWNETTSLTFSARHDDADAAYSEGILDGLESLSLKLEDRFETVPGGITVVVHPNGAWLDFAHPFLPLVRWSSAPAGRRYLVGWAMTGEIHVLGEAALEKRAAGDASFEALKGSAERLYAQLVIAANNGRMPPPWSPSNFRRYLEWAWLVEGSAQHFARQVDLFRPAVIRRLREGARPTFPPARRDATILGGTVFDLLEEYRGVLSTQSQAMPGFPFGSVVPYCLDEQGRPLILISRIAQHTRNLKADPRCSLLVGERDAEDVQAAGRLTLLAEARQLVEADAIDVAAQRYYRYFPDSRDYHRVHDFDFWVLQPVRWRYIGGFGAIHWLEQVALANPFAGEGGAVERSMVEHMNEDHAAAIAHYVREAGLPQEPKASLVGIDSEGFHLRIGQRLFWLAFAEPCATPQAVRQALVAMARASRSAGLQAGEE